MITTYDTYSVVCTIHTIPFRDNYSLQASDQADAVTSLYALQY